MIFGGGGGEQKNFRPPPPSGYIGCKNAGEYCQKYPKRRDRGAWSDTPEELYGIDEGTVAQVYGEDRNICPLFWDDRLRLALTAHPVVVNWKVVTTNCSFPLVIPLQSKKLKR